MTLASTGAPEAPPNSVAAVDPVSRELVRAIPVGNAPTDIAASVKWVWVLNSNDGAGTITKIDAKTRATESVFSVTGTPRSLVAAFGSLWVGTVEGRVLRIDPETDLPERSWTLPNAGASSAFEEDQGAGWLAKSPKAVWAGSSRTLSRIDPETSTLVHRESASGPMAYGFGSIWIIGSQEVARLSAATMRRVGTVRVTGFYVDVATGLGSVWLADDDGNAVVQVDPGQEAVERTYSLGGAPFGVAVGAGAAWAASDDGTVARIDPERDDVEQIAVGGAPRSVDIGAGEVWVSVD